MRSSVLSALFLGLALCACAPQGASDTAAAAPVAQSAVKTTVETIAEGFEFPWGLAFLPDGEILVTEREGRLRRIVGGALAAEPVSGVPQALVERQGGLLDVAIHPRFAENRFVYLSYSAGTVDANATHLARGRYEDGALKDVQVIFKVSPEKRAGVHFGGRILFLPDETLILTLGDGFRYRDEAQNLENHLGKMVRLKDDGSIPADNPFVSQDKARGEIFSWGHRNVQGIARDPASGRIFAAEFGPQGGDELNVLSPGKNYGWPLITYGKEYSGGVISPFTAREGLEQPIAHWVPSISPSGIAFYTGELFPQWRGDVLLACLTGMQLRRVDLDDAGVVVGQETLLTDLQTRFRHVVQGPDGALYLLTDEPEGKLLRVTPAA